MVSVGVTAHAAFVEPPVVVLVVVVVSGLVGESPQPSASAAPAALITPIASRRPIFLLLIDAPSGSIIPVTSTRVRRLLRALPREPRSMKQVTETRWQKLEAGTTKA
jgi:hypothetical protein